MGAWGLGSFDNDDAMDWMVDFSEKQNIAFLEETFDLVLSNGDSEYIAAFYGSNAIAAAEIVAAAIGNISNSFPEHYLNKSDEIEVEKIDLPKLKAAITQDIITKAKSALVLVKSNKNSELRQLWEEVDDYSDWLNDMGELEKRLN